METRSTSWANLLSFTQTAVATFGRHFRELIYSPLGFSIIDGRQTAPVAVSDHWDHVHMADYGAIVKGPAMIQQGNITEAHIPLTGPGARRFQQDGPMRLEGRMRIENWDKGIVWFEGMVRDGINDAERFNASRGRAYGR